MGVAYATEADLMVGAIPTPAYIDKAAYLNQASDEVDSYLAAVYATPINLPDVSPNQIDPERETRLVLKRVTSQLASARIILAAAAGGEDTEIHAYGKLLLNEALRTLRQLATGEPMLPGATVNPNAPEADGSGLPLVVNGDAFSEVDRFYGLTNQGGLMYGP